MPCCYCRAIIPDGAHFCVKCGKPQNTLVSAPVNRQGPDPSTPAPSVSSPELLQAALMEEGMKGQAALVQSHYQLHGQLMLYYDELAKRQKELDTRLKKLDAKLTEPEPNPE